MKSFLKFIGGIFAIIVSICFFAFMFAFTISNITANTVTREGIRDYLHDVDIMNFPVGALIGDNDSVQIDDNATLSNVLKDYLKVANIDDAMANKIVNDKKSEILLTDFLGDYIYYYIYQKEIPKINALELLDIIDDNIKLSSEEKSDITTAINELNDSFVEEAELSTEESFLPDGALTTINIFNSKLFYLYLAGTILFFALLISLLRWCFYSPLNWLGIPLLIVGIIYGIILITKNTIISLINISSNELTALLKKLTDPFFNKILIYVIIYIVVSIICIIIHSRIRKIKIRKKNIEILNQTVVKPNELR